MRLLYAGCLVSLVLATAVSARAEDDEDCFNQCQVQDIVGYHGGGGKAGSGQCGEITPAQQKEYRKWNDEKETLAQNKVEHGGLWAESYREQKGDRVWCRCGGGHNMHPNCYPLLPHGKEVPCGDNPNNKNYKLNGVVYSIGKALGSASTPEANLCGDETPVHKKKYAKFPGKGQGGGGKPGSSGNEGGQGDGGSGGGGGGNGGGAF